VHDQDPDASVIHNLPSTSTTLSTGFTRIQMSPGRATLEASIRAEGSPRGLALGGPLIAPGAMSGAPIREWSGACGARRPWRTWTDEPGR